MGEDFGDLAKEYSDDIWLGSGRRRVGLDQPGQMVPEFDATMATTESGEISYPVKSQFGWHILEVTGRRDQNIAEQMRRQQVMGYLARSKVRRRARRVAP